jgi:hypothetical protein
MQRWNNVDKMENKVDVSHITRTSLDEYFTGVLRRSLINALLKNKTLVKGVNNDI